MRRENCAKRFACQRRAQRFNENVTKRYAGYFSEAAALVARPGATTGWRKGIMARSLGPNCSTGWFCSRCRVARKFGQPFSFSSIHFLAKLPSRISERILRISSRVLRVGKSQRFGFAGGVLLNGDERGSSATFGEYLANAMSGSFGRDHGDVDVGGWLD